MWGGTPNSLKQPDLHGRDSTCTGLPPALKLPLKLQYLKILQNILARKEKIAGEMRPREQNTDWRLQL